ncbi:transposase [Bacillus sp. FJAT-42376]|nr:transposase [Bacillus sp. FJAT-42376]
MTEGRVKAEVARELGLAEQTLHNWIKKYEESDEKGFVGSGNVKPENEESHRLNKRIRDLEEEKAILKKAMGIFARNPK